MKKALLTILLILGFCSVSLAAGTVAQSDVVLIGKDVAMVIFTCTGDGADGTIPATDLSTANTNYLKSGNFALTDVIAFPTPGGTAPDAADVTVKVKNFPTVSSGSTTVTPGVPEDLLDGLGANLIHATDMQSMGANMTVYWRVISPLTLAVANQATVSATYTIIFKFER